MKDFKMQGTAVSGTGFLQGSHSWLRLNKQDLNQAIKMKF